MNAIVMRLWPVVALAVGIVGAASAGRNDYPGGGLDRGLASGSRIAVAPVTFEGSLEPGPTAIWVVPADGRTGAGATELPAGGRTLTALVAQRENVLARVVQEAIRQALSAPSGRQSRIVPARHAAQAETALGLSARSFWLPIRGDAAATTTPAVDAVHVRAYADRTDADLVLLARARVPKVLDVTPAPGASGGIRTAISSGEIVVTVDAALIRARDGVVVWREQQSARPEPRPERRVHAALRGDAFQSMLDAAARAGSALGMSLRAAR